MREELLYSVRQHLTGILNLLHYVLPTINLVLFEKPALDSRKLASEKGNNLILSNLAEAGKYCNPFRALRMHVCIWLCVHVSLCLCTYVGLCTCTLPRETDVSESVILIFASL